MHHFQFLEAFGVTSIILLTLLSAFFTMAKTALVTVRHAWLHHATVDDGTQSGRTLQALIQQPARIFATVQVGITLATFGAAAVAAAILGPALAVRLSDWHIPHPIWVAATLATLVAALFNITVGELIPYSYAQRHPQRAARLVAGPIRVFVTVFSVLASIALAVSNALIRPFGLTASFGAPLITEEELQTLLEAGARSGAIEQGEKEIIQNVISFGDTDVRHVMTPRIDMRALDVGQDIDTMVALILESGHSRIPVYEGSVDVIVGIVHAKDLLPLLATNTRDVSLREVARAPLVVPENKRIDELLEEFRRSNTQLAIVQDEYGGTAGLVSIEDLLEELVGEIKDEYDREEPLLERVDDETWIVDGRMGIDDVNEQLGLELPEEEFDTIGGFVFGLFGRQPREGESTRHGSALFTIAKTDGRRIQTIRLQRCQPEEPEPQETARED
jgi:putative hemolysin